MANKNSTQFSGNGKVVGIDVGYGFTKAVGNQNRVMFPSVLGPAEEVLFHPALSENGHGLTVTVDGKTYFIGERALSQSRWASGTLDRVRVGTEEAKVLYLAALAQLLPNGSTSVSVMTGLPITWLKDARALVHNWQGYHKVKVDNGSAIRFDVKHVEVVPQAWGTLVREMVTADGKGIKDAELMSGDVGIVDFGTLTVNFLGFRAKDYIGKESSSLELGMARVLERLQPVIRDTHGLNYSLPEVDAALRLGHVKVYGTQHPLDELVRPILEEIIEPCLAEARRLWGDGRQKDRILLTGGGANVLGAAFKKAYQHPNAGVVLDSQWANAEGLLLWAKMVG